MASSLGHSQGRDSAIYVVGCTGAARRKLGIFNFCLQDERAGRLRQYMTTQLPIRYVIVEGPDLSGKTTFIRQLHKATGFYYNIQDRSCLSMLCYAKQYSRDIETQKQFLREELSDLNNFFVILLPSEEVLLDRLAFRGDEFQNASSVVTLRKLFEESIRFSTCLTCL